MEDGKLVFRGLGRSMYEGKGDAYIREYRHQ